MRSRDGFAAGRAQRRREPEVVFIGFLPDTGRDGVTLCNALHQRHDHLLCCGGRIVILE